MNEGPVLVGFERVRTGCVAAFLTFFDHKAVMARAGTSAFVQRANRFFGGEGRLRRATIIEARVAAKTAALSARPRSHLFAHRRCGTGSEY